MELSEISESAIDCKLGRGKRSGTEVFETELVGREKGGSVCHDMEEGRIRKTIRIDSESILDEGA